MVFPFSLPGQTVLGFCPGGVGVQVDVWVTLLSEVAFGGGMVSPNAGRVYYVIRLFASLQAFVVAVV